MTSKQLFYFLTIFVVFIKSASLDQCITPNQEIASCVPLESCPILMNGMKTLDDAAIDFTKKSICKTEGNVHHVCCGTSSYSKIQACITPNQESGRCVKLESCAIIFDGVKALNRTVFDFAAKSICKTEGNVQYVCCGTSSYLLSTAVKTTEKMEKAVSDRKYYCGYHDDTTIDEFPWVALLIQENGTVKNRQDCLGTLINNRYVVTTYICAISNAAYEFKITSVLLGKYNENTTSDCANSKEYNECSNGVIRVGVEETILHPNFKIDLEGISFNIALIRLARKITFTDYIRPICLPNLNSKAQIGDQLTTSGWGITEWKTDLEKKPKMKKKGVGTVVPLSVCANNSEIHLAGILNERYYICFSEGANGSCIDDSSAPLMSKHKNQWQLEGIFSLPTAQKCGEGSFNIYVNVTTHMQWIVDTVKP